MLSIFKRRRRTIEPVNADLRVHYINPDADTIDAGLGISEERMEELQVCMEDLFRDKGTGDTLCIEEIMEAISCKVKHPNELAFVCYVLGSFTNQMRQIGLINSMLGQ